MTKKNEFSKRTLYVIESLWLCFSVIISIIIKDTYHIDLWIILSVGGLFLIVGRTLIRKFIKVNK